MILKSFIQCCGIVPPFPCIKLGCGDIVLWGNATMDLVMILYLASRQGKTNHLRQMVIALFLKMFLRSLIHNLYHCVLQYFMIILCLLLSRYSLQSTYLDHFILFDNLTTRTTDYQGFLETLYQFVRVCSGLSGSDFHILSAPSHFRSHSLNHVNQMLVCRIHV